jgi:putative Holliday junction resolvase
MNYGSILALDVGEVRIGTAISDPTQTLATPNKTIPRHNAIKHIANMVVVHDIQYILVGIPYLPSGEKGTQVMRTESFIKQLAMKINLPIASIDERFSSIEAINKINSTNHKPKSKKLKKLRDSVDSAAAAIFLQAHLEKKVP